MFYYYFNVLIELILIMIKVIFKLYGHYFISKSLMVPAKC